MIVPPTNHVVEMGHHEIGLGDVHVDRKRREKHTGQAADREKLENPSAYSIGALNRTDPYTWSRPS